MGTAESGSNGLSASARKATSTQGNSQASPSATPQPSVLRRSSSSNLAPQVSSPLAQSPRTSRNTSPIRKDQPPAKKDALSTKPSAAAIQRALSASSVPHLHQQTGNSVSEAVSKLPGRGPKGAAASGESTPQWPISPRLKSPPPSGPSSRRGSAAAQKKPEAGIAPPSIQVLSATPQNYNTSMQPSSRTASTEDRRPDPQLQPPPPPKASARGPSGKSTLETVQENSADSQEPSPAAVQSTVDLKPLAKMTGNDDRSPKRESSVKGDEQKLTESGSESTGNKSDTNIRGRDRQQSATHNATNQSQSRSKNAPSKNNYAGTTTKSRQGEGKIGGMTVETETVQSIPQSGLAPAGEAANRLRSDNGGSIRLKPSTETIRPRKERRKDTRTKRSVNQGTATSKADLFERRVADAVDEANTSDSDETFVYESNPVEPQRRQRHHSRTPSVTSAHSIVDQQRSAIRGFGDAFDDRRVEGKRSMKFSSRTHNDFDSPDSKDGTIRSHTPRHIGRYGRGGPHSASYDPQNHQDSPYTQASKLRQNHVQRSRPNSPRSPQSMQLRSGGFLANNRKQEQPYDFEQNADDERTPLVGSGTVRGPRGYTYRSIRRSGSSMAHSFNDYEEPNRRWRCCSGKAGACFLTTLLAIAVVVSAVFFVFASNRPLYDVEVHEIKNVLASEQELMLDLKVGAVNPNTLGINIGDMDVNIFAKSKHVSNHKPDKENDGSGKLRRRQRISSNLSDKKDSRDKNPNPIQDPDGHWHAPGDDDGDDSDAEKDAQTMLLGRIFKFDQALNFGASPINHHLHFSTGQLRLTKPGNKTETGGSERWEKVIQYPFELIVRGVLKYQLPISSRLQSAAVGASVMVHPEEGIDKKGNMRLEPVDHSEHWQWIEWLGLMDDPEVDDPDERAEASRGETIS
ncbi:hypothetical protein DOTSEDRAFT_134310 [Dothistroma septosporum NZE10]|uniref:Uncharacterized protein n=1 Tax=Dothistroma septosporum (strain NZE10 / CBS 128990) TaxID=675120 RepID=N1PJ36_DOTSN|nr:hypothetical protein DOTSEDRAFT_134310 [Dothistroma septosporum NZE10]